MSRNTQIQKVSVVCGQKRPRKQYRKPTKSSRAPHGSTFGVPAFKVIPVIHHQPPPFQLPMTLDPKPTPEPPATPPRSPVKTEPASPIPSTFQSKEAQNVHTPRGTKRTRPEFEEPSRKRSLNFSPLI